jgi:hypothetical protein
LVAFGLGEVEADALGAFMVLLAFFFGGGFGFVFDGCFRAGFWLLAGILTFDAVLWLFSKISTFVPALMLAVAPTNNGLGLFGSRWMVPLDQTVGHRGDRMLGKSVSRQAIIPKFYIRVSIHCRLNHEDRVQTLQRRVKNDVKWM